MKVVFDENSVYENSEITERGVFLESPCRIDVMSDDSMIDFKLNIDVLEKSYKISIEDPLPNAVTRGVKYVVFLDKYKIDGNDIQWIQI